MKICLINNLYPPFERGSGAEQVCVNLKTGLIALGHEVIIIACRPWNKPAPDDTDLVYLPSFYPLLNKLPRHLRLIWHLLNLCGLYKPLKIRSIIKRKKIDLIISHNLMGLGFLTARLVPANCRYVQVLHDVQLLHPSGLIYWQQEKIIANRFAEIYQWLTAFCFDQVDLIISPSHWLKKLHQSQRLFYEKKFITLTNPRPQSLTQFNAKPDQRFFLFVGQLVKHKGADLLLDAWLKSCEQKRAGLLFVGGGPLQKSLEQRAAGIDSVKFLGKVPNEQVTELMSKAYCLVVPSLCYENSPTIILEAIESNLPIIGSDLGGVPELLHHQPELLFEPNANALAQKLNWALKHPRALNESFNKIRGRYQPLTVSDYLETILKEL